MSPEEHLKAALVGLGYDLSDPEMAETPRRWAGVLASLAGNTDDLAVSTCAGTSSSPVVMRGIPFWSICAHHMLPFFGTVDIGYEPAETLIGFGSLPRMVADRAARPQLQERMAEELATALWDAAQPRSVAVRIVARHLCVEMRHPHPPQDIVVTAVRGTPTGGVAELTR